MEVFKGYIESLQSFESSKSSKQIPTQMTSKVTEGSLGQSNYEGLQELRRFYETRFQDALSLIALERRCSDSYFSIIYNFGSTLGGEHFEFEYLRYVKVAEVFELDQGVHRLFNIL